MCCLKVPVSTCIDIQVNLSHGAYTKVRALADPVAVGDLIRVSPEWWDVRVYRTDSDSHEENIKESERSKPGTSAGKDKDGNALNIASAVYDGLQVIGHSKHGGAFQFCSSEGAETMDLVESAPHAILANTDEYEWRKVAVKDLNACAGERGIDLAYFADRKGDKLYACRIEFYGWVNPEYSSSESQTKMVKGGDTEDSKCLLPGMYRAGSGSPEFCYDGRFNRSLDKDAVVELLCYKELQQEMKTSYFHGNSVSLDY